MPDDLLASIGLSIAVAGGLALVARLSGQPLILAYIAAGVLIGPRIGFGLVTDEESIKTISEIGLILLLFMIGLEIDLKKLAAAGRPVLVTGLLQVSMCLALGMGFFTLLASVGFPFAPGSLDIFYLAAAASLSSTLIVVKLLYDKLELDTLAGRITVGVLVLQDLWAIIFLAVQPNLKDPQVVDLLLSLVQGVALVGLSFAASRYVLPTLFRTVARLPEVVLLLSLGWCFVIAGLAGLAGLSREMGALIAGVSLSTFPYNQEVIARIVSIRDFFLTLFFVALGMTLPIPGGMVVATAATITGFIILTRFISVMPVLHLLGLGNRVSLLTSINLSQISEFSIVLAALGASYGHITEDTATIIIVTMIFTSILSTYLVNYSHTIHLSLNPLLEKVGVRDIGSRREIEAGEEEGEGKSIFMLGFFRVASSLLQKMESESPGLLKEVLVIDFNPDVHRELKGRGVKCVYGDISHMETLKEVRIERAQVFLSTIPDGILKGTDNLKLIKQVRRLAPNASIVCTAESIPSALEMYREGAAYVLLPRVAAAEELMEVLNHIQDRTLDQLHDQQIASLQGRNEVV